LGCVGIYAVLSYAVSQRTAEIGIRSALGATPGNMHRMIVSQGMWLVASGVLIGLIATVALSGLLTVAALRRDARRSGHACGGYGDLFGRGAAREFAARGSSGGHESA
jgi:ABC-type antimicrobial peptide transport system permease subunit